MRRETRKNIGATNRTRLLPKIISLREQGLSVRTIATLTQMSHQSVINYLKAANVYKTLRGRQSERYRERIIVLRATKPSFRSAFKRRRCLVVADGYYEWKAIGKKKQPYYHRLTDERPFAFAGLWERWDKGEKPVESCTILTTDANSLAAGVHDRMPVILPHAAYKPWLDPEIEDAGALQELLCPFPAAEMTAYPVNPIVNKAGNEGAECIAAVNVEE